MTDNDPGAPDERTAREIRGYLAALADMFGDPNTLGAEPLAVARAAALVRRVATAYAHTAGAQARGAGATWDEVADALLTPTPTWSSRLRAAAAFDQVAEDNRYPHPPSVRWTCSTCAARVEDYGPERPTPYREIGHVSGCRRRTAELAAAAHGTHTSGPEGTR